MIRRSTRSRSQRSARSLVEFALVALVFFLILFGIFEYARLLFTMQLLNNAAREGARFAVVNVNTATTANVQTYVDGYMARQGYTQLVNYSPTTNITVYEADPTTGANTGLSWTNAPWGTGIGVSITGTYQPLTPGLLLITGSLTLTGTCVMTVEAN